MVETIRLDARKPEQLAVGGLDALQAELETNFYGPLRTSQAFAPMLAANGGGVIVNVLSVSWINLPGRSTYCASKSAAWGLTNGLRNELRAQKTQVVGVHIAFIDTDRVRHIPGQKIIPEDVSRQGCEALKGAKEEVLADGLSRARSSRGCRWSLACICSRRAERRTALSRDSKAPACERTGRWLSSARG